MRRDALSRVLADKRFTRAEPATIRRDIGIFDTLLDNGGEVFNLKHPRFGVAADGVKDDTIAFSTAKTVVEAAAAADGAATLIIPSGDYLAERLLIEQSGVIVRIEKGTTFTRTNPSADEGIIEFKGGASGASTTLGSSEPIATLGLDVSSSSGFSVGDWIEIESEAAISAQSPYLYEINRVESIPNSTSINVRIPTRNAYSIAGPTTVHVRRIEPLERVGLVGGYFDAAGGTTTDCVRIEYCIDPILSHGTVQNYGNRGLILHRCFGGVVEDWTATAGADASNSWGISLHSCEGVTLRSCRVFDHDWDGFDLSFGAMYNMLTNCRAENVGNSGYNVGHGVHGHHNQLVGCQATYCHTGFQLGNTSFEGDDDNEFLGCVAFGCSAEGYQIIEDSTGNRFVGCRSKENTGKGWDFGGTSGDNHATACVATDCGGTGFHVENPSTDLVECTAFRCSGNGFRFETGSENSRAIACKARQNTLHNFLVNGVDDIEIINPIAISAGGSNNGVYVSNAQDCLIVNPIARGNGGYGVRVFESASGNCRRTRIEGLGHYSTNGTAPVTTNHDASTAIADGDTTPSVAGSSLFSTQNSGSTTVTNFDDGFDGQLITILGDANTTIQDNANLVLNGSANFAMSANDTLTLQKIGGVWYEITRSVN